MSGIESLTSEEIRKILMEQYEYSEEAAYAIKGKPNLALELAQLHYVPKKNNSFFDTLEEDRVDTSTEQESVNEEDANEITIPEMGSEEWQDYVMAHLLPNEVVKDGDKFYPKCAGLRRVAFALLGPIIESGITFTQIPVEMNPQTRVVVGYRVKFDWQLNDYMVEGRDVRTFDDISEASCGNVPQAFFGNLVATAATRAEGRCLKRALLLNLYTAEEMINEKNTPQQVETITDGAFREDSPITGAQKTNINKLCKKHKIDMSKFINHYLPGKAVLDDLLSSEGANLCSLLNRFQARGKEHLDIPEEIKNATTTEI